MGDADILHVIKTTVSATPCKSTHRKMEETATLTKDQRSDPSCTVQLKAIVKQAFTTRVWRWVHTMRQKMVHSFLPHDYFSWNSASVQCFFGAHLILKPQPPIFYLRASPLCLLSRMVQVLLQYLQRWAWGSGCLEASFSRFPGLLNCIDS